MRCRGEGRPPDSHHAVRKSAVTRKLRYTPARTKWTPGPRTGPGVKCTAPDDWPRELLLPVLLHVCGGMAVLPYSLRSVVGWLCCLTHSDQWWDGCAASLTQISGGMAVLPHSLRSVVGWLCCLTHSHHGAGRLTNQTHEVIHHPDD